MMGGVTITSEGNNRAEKDKKLVRVRIYWERGKKHGRYGKGCSYIRVKPHIAKVERQIQKEKGGYA